MGGKRSRQRDRITTELTADERRVLHRLLIDGATYDDIEAHLKRIGYDISRSAIGRYGKTFFEFYKQSLINEDKAREFVGAVGEGLALEEAASKLLFGSVIQKFLDGDIDVVEMPRILSDVAKLQSSSVQREKYKADIDNRVKAAADAVEAVAKKGGVSAATIEIIRREILGITT